MLPTALGPSASALAGIGRRFGTPTAAVSGRRRASRRFTAGRIETTPGPGGPEGAPSCSAGLFPQFMEPRVPWPDLANASRGGCERCQGHLHESRRRERCRAPIVPKRTRGRGASPQPLVCIGSGGRTRTCDPAVNSRLLYQLSYAGSDWRRGPESNRCTRLCRPLRSHSATAPTGATALGGQPDRSSTRLGNLVSAPGTVKATQGRDGPLLVVSQRCF